MTCKICNEIFGKPNCLSCGEIFISCDCTLNICYDCRLEIYTNPVKHRFGIAWFALLDCLDHLDDQLSRQEEMAKENLLRLVEGVN
jgi:hypothetical protein